MGSCCSEICLEIRLTWGLNPKNLPGNRSFKGLARYSLVALWVLSKAQPCCEVNMLCHTIWRKRQDHPGILQPYLPSYSVQSYLSCYGTSYYRAISVLISGKIHCLCLMSAQNAHRASAIAQRSTLPPPTISWQPPSWSWWRLENGLPRFFSCPAYAGYRSRKSLLILSLRFDCATDSIGPGQLECKIVAKFVDCLWTSVHIPGHSECVGTNFQGASANWRGLFVWSMDTYMQIMQKPPSSKHRLPHVWSWRRTTC